KDGKVIIWDVTGRLKDGELTPARLEAREVDSLWNDLRGTDDKKASQAVWTLIAAGDSAIAHLTEKVLHVPKRGFDAAKVENLIADLDDNKFEVREKASEELEKMGVVIEPALKKALEKSTSAERTRRLTELLEKISKHGGTPREIAGRR